MVGLHVLYQAPIIGLIIDLESVLAAGQNMDTVKQYFLEVDADSLEYASTIYVSEGECAYNLFGHLLIW